MRITRAIGSLLTTTLIALPVVAHANALDDIQSQVAAMLAQITDLKSQVLQMQALQYLNAASTSATTTAAVNQLIKNVAPAITTFLQSAGVSTSSTVAPPSSSLVDSALAVCPTLARTLRVGARGADVTSLQQFLISLGLLNSDSASGYFGALTQTAVQKWQMQNGLVSSGTPATTGWGLVGARTRAAITTSCGGTAGPQNDTISVGVRYLSVEARVSVNSKGSCSAQSYVLDWGDGTPAQTFSVAKDSCLPFAQTFTHEYADAGAYTIVLSTSAYRISAPVALTAIQKCAAPSFATDSIPGAIVGQRYTLPLFVSLDATGLSVGASGQPGGLMVARGIIVNASTSATSYIWSLSGTPTTTGTYSITFTGKNSCGSASRTISLPVTDNVSRCTLPVTPSCINGTLQSIGNDSNGCSLGYACIIATGTTAPTCPVVLASECLNGTYISQGFDSNGCVRAPLCVPNASGGL